MKLAVVSLALAGIGSGLALAQQPAAQHWGFRPVVRPPLPTVKNATWVRNPIDAFIAARHEAKGLTPAPEAPRRTLIRRLSLDLTGLAPSTREIEQFVNDPAPDTYEQLVE